MRWVKAGSLLAGYLLFSVFGVAAQAASEREIAEWVIRWEGSILLDGSAVPLKNISQLPAGEIHIAAIELTGGVMHPIELTKLAGLTGVRELYLPGPIWNPGGGNEDRSGVFQALATLTSVERLAFGWHYNAQMEVGDKEISALVAWKNLKELRCSQCRSTFQIYDLSPFAQLHDLDLSYNPFTDQGMAGLANLKELRRLMLRDTLVTDEGLKYLADLDHLEEIDLSGTRVTDKVIEYLRKLKSMRRLNLLGAQATDAAMDVFAGMDHLEVLNLYRTRVTNSGVAKLKALKNLTDIDLRYSRVTPNGVDDLHADLPVVPSVRFSGFGSAPAAKSPGAAEPTADTEEAISKWVKALGGSTEFAAGASGGD